MMRVGADLMGRALAALARGSLAFTPQAAEGVTYAAKITKEECHIDFTRPAQAVHDHIRGLAPFPGAFTLVNGARLKVLKAEVATGAGAPGTLLSEDLVIACGTGALRLLDVQPAGKSAMRAADFQRGAKLAAGALFV
jgi:methionyl-tRNA formyltransferase